VKPQIKKDDSEELTSKDEKTQEKTKPNL